MVSSVRCPGCLTNGVRNCTHSKDRVSHLNWQICASVDNIPVLNLRRREAQTIVNGQIAEDEEIAHPYFCSYVAVRVERPMQESVRIWVSETVQLCDYQFPQVL